MSAPLQFVSRTPNATSASDLARRIAAHEAAVAIVGLGYFGLPLGLSFADAGFKVTGIDADSEKVAGLLRGVTNVTDVTREELLDAVQSRRLSPTLDWETLQRADVVVICVPTPLRKTKDPDLTHVIAATEQVAAHLHPGQLVVL